MALSSHRQTERDEDDRLGIDEVRKLSRKIMTVVADPKMHPTIATKAARAVVERRLSPEEFVELCDTIVAKRMRNEIESTGAYFVASLKRLFQRNDIPWRTPKSKRIGGWEDLL